jgi:hypothetical protein
VYELTARGAALAPAIYELGRWGLDLLDEPGADVLPLHAVPLGLKGLVRLEALPDRGLVVALVLDAGEWTVRVAPAASGGRAIDRVTVSAGAAPDAAVTARGALLDLVPGRAAAGGGVRFAGPRGRVADAAALLAVSPLPV